LTKDGKALVALLEAAGKAIDSARQAAGASAYPGVAVVARELALMLDSISDAPKCETPLSRRPDPSLVGRIVTDSWDLTSSLADVVLRAAKAYERMHQGPQ
jgi:hypothetical protein